MLDILPEWFRIFFFSMIPWLESRYVIPFAINLGWEWWNALPLAIAGNMLPIPIILLFFKYAEKRLRKYKFWFKLMDWLFTRTRERANETIHKYLGLLIFVALPIPFTGAWTGALIAYLFNLKFGKSLIAIFIGVISAAGIMTIVTLTGIDLLYIIVGVIIAGVIMGLFIFVGSTKKK
jgi:uncharacterized membrane protein